MVARSAVALIAVAACGRVYFDPLHDFPRGDGGQDAPSGPRIVDIALSGDHTCALASTGQLKCWGENNWGILGIGSPDTSPRGDQPGELAAMPLLDLGTNAQILQLGAGIDYTCAVLAPGVVKCWGNNDGYQLGTGDSTQRGDQPNQMGDNLLPVSLSPGGVAAVTCGHYHTCVLRGDRIACWGLDDTSQLGYATAKTTPTDLATLPDVDLGTFEPQHVSSGFNHTCALDGIGRVKCWGYGADGELGLGDTTTRGDMTSDMGNNLPFVNLGTGVTALAICTGDFHGCAMTSVGLKCWGRNDHGQLGLGNAANRGDGPSEMGDMLPVVDVGGPIDSVACGSASTCVVRSGSDVLCWGENVDGQLGVGDTADRGDEPGEMGANLVRVPLPEPAIRVAMGGGHVCAILASGALACWGRGASGQLGSGSTANIGVQPGDMPVIHTVPSLWP